MNPVLKKNDQTDRLSSQDIKLGRLLAREIPGGRDMTDCPTMERLSEFIDGKLTDEDRESITAHLIGCADCYAVLSESLSIREELNRRSRARIRKYFYYSIPAALAAAAVLLLVFSNLHPTPESGGSSALETAMGVSTKDKWPLLKSDIPAARSFAGKLADRVAGNNSAASLARIAGKQSKAVTSSYGFSSFVPLEKAAFRIGVCLTDLEVALKAKDKEKIEVFAKKLIELLRPMESSYGLIPSIIERRAPDGNSGKEASRYEGFSRAVEALLENKKEAVFLKFGEWVEAANLAAEIRDAAFFQLSDVQGFSKGLENSGVPMGTLRNMSKLETLISTGGLKSEEFNSISLLLADIKEMF